MSKARITSAQDTTNADDRMAPGELKRRLDAGEEIVVVDVREPDEYEDWHIPGAINVPLDELQAGARIQTADGQPIVTVCAWGVRSDTAADLLADRGYEVTNLAGGMIGWNGVYESVPVEADQVPDGAQVRQIRRVGKGCLGYLIVSDGQGAVIDPTLDTDVFRREVEALGAELVASIETHAHADHIAGGRWLAEALDIPHYAPDTVGTHSRLKALSDGDQIHVGQVAIDVIHTPGHTPGSLTFRLGDLAFTGDTLFVESVGRPDLKQDATENGRVLWKTLHERLATLPERTLILPGHAGEEVDLEPGEPWMATLGTLSEELEAFGMDEEAFVSWVEANTTPKPSNFGDIKRFNVGDNRRETVDDLDDLRELEAGPNRCAVSG